MKKFALFFSFIIVTELVGMDSNKDLAPIIKAISDGNKLNGGRFFACQ